MIRCAEPGGRSEAYGHYNLGASVMAKFKDSKLTYLAVSKVESN
jgi:hypothetical protein